MKILAIGNTFFNRYPTTCFLSATCLSAAALCSAMPKIWTV